MSQQLITREPVPYYLDRAPSPRESDFVQIGDVLRALGVLWRHKLLVLLFTLIGVAAGKQWYDRTEPLFESTAQVLVVQKRQTAISEGMTRPSYLQDGSPIHVRILKSPMFAERVCERERVRELPSLAGMTNPVHGVVTSLSVSPETEDTPGSISSVLKLSFDSTHPEDARIILEEVITTYEEYLHETTQNVNDDALSLMMRKSKEVEAHLKTLQDEYQEFRRTARLTSLPDEERREGIETRRLELEIRRAELEGQISAMEQAVAEDRNQEFLVGMMTEFVKKDDASRSSVFEQQLLSLVLKEQELLEDYGPGHPKVRNIREQLKRTRSMTSERMKLLGLNPGTTVSREVITNFIDSLKHELLNVSTAEVSLTNLAGEMHETATERADYNVRDQQFTSDIERAKHFYETLMTQMQGVNFSRDLTGYTTSLLAPATSAVQVAPRTLFVLGVPSFLGMLFGMLFAYVIEFFDKTFRDSNDVSRRLQSVVIGHIPRLPKGRRHLGRRGVAEGSLSDPTLCTYFRPASYEAEAYRSVRTSLYFCNGSGLTRVVQITSPNSGDGKSTLVANLGVSIAQSGQRTLLIDADLRSSRLHNIFGVSATEGLSSVISGTAEIQDAIVQTQIPGLSVLPAGPRPHNPSELLTSPRFKHLLDALRDAYDFVLIDTPPLLAVTDPAVVAPRVDGVLLTIRISKNGRPRAERAREILGMLGARVLGVVINAVDQGTDSDRFYGSPNPSDSGDRYYQEDDGIGDRTSEPFALVSGKIPEKSFSVDRFDESNGRAVHTLPLAKGDETDH